jgi:hypothetical protein
MYPARARNASPPSPHAPGQTGYWMRQLVLFVLKAIVRRGGKMERFELDARGERASEGMPP